MITIPDWDWIKENSGADLDRLRLKFGKDSDKQFAIEQIDCRRRAAAKLPQTLRNDRFLFPSKLAAEQSTSDVLAQYHSDLVGQVDSALDMTCGLGIDSFHIARKVNKIISIELDPIKAECAAYNADVLGLENMWVACGNSVDYIKICEPDSFDTIFIDPARRGDGGKRLYAISDCEPDVEQLLPQMLTVAKRIIMKASPMIDISDTLRRLCNVSRIIACGLPRECKELIIIAERGFDGEPTITSATVDKDGRWQEFQFAPGEESAAEYRYGNPEIGGYLYEPYSSTQKSAPYKLLCQRFDAAVISANTHLYASATPLPSFPGIEYEVLDCMDYNKASIKEIREKYPKADVTVRNFPLTAQQLTAKLKIKPSSGALRLFAFTDRERKLKIVIFKNRAITADF